MPDSAYNIFNASAGSGKTFTLVKEYLKIILSSENNQKFRQILAITFTNKAVNEMKQRILESLAEISTHTEDSEDSEMAKVLIEELNTDSESLREIAKKQLQNILHNYAYFDVSTIDKFTHRIIRTFAKDLKISQNFEVILDTDLLLEESVENLLAQAGQEKLLTKVLIDFALEKTDADKSWSLQNDLFKSARMIFQENDLPHLKRLDKKSIKDFVKLQQKLRSDIREIQKKAVTLADNILRLIDEAGLTAEDFPNKTLPRHFDRIKSLDWDLKSLYGNKLEENLQAGKILKSGNQFPNEDLPIQIVKTYLEAKKLILEWWALQNAYLNILPLTLLNAIYKEVKQIEAERDLLPISSFNNIISETIADQPAPFIYERLGEKYRHYFIDEFQDTSQMQWNNLIPLVGNALESIDTDGNTGSVLLVGDIKQAIYRWRGGKAEQLLNLINLREDPFVVKPTVFSLETNYRSAREIIQFNNEFFRSTSSFISKEIYHKLFAEETQQKYNAKEGGLVQIEFINNPDSDKDQAYFDSVKRIIDSVLEQGYEYHEICILTRKKKEGILISQKLIEAGMPIVSSETLLLSSSPKIKFLVDLLRLAYRPDDRELAFSVLNFLINKDLNYHITIEKALEDPEQWLRENCKFNLESLHFKALYDGIEEAVRLFDLVSESDAFVTYFLDEVLKLEQRQESGIASFLDFWEKNKEKLSITAPENFNAVKVMTIHKAKGLEFPIVIFPYANTNIYQEIDAKLWIGVDDRKYSGFSELLFSKNQHMTKYSGTFPERYVEEQQKLELDGFNILYVVLTRAVEGLYIITEKDLDKNGNHKTSFYSGLFIHHLIERGLWSVDKDTYTFGNLNEHPIIEKAESAQEAVEFMLSNKQTTAPKMVIRNATLWDDQRMLAIERGTLIHYVLGLIETQSDMDRVEKQMRAEGRLVESEAKTLFKLISRIINHPDLESYFLEGAIIKNEQEIIDKNGLILRPDRLVIENNKVTVIDYKTGLPQPQHKDQVIKYGEALVEMGFELENRIIVYIEKDVKVEFIK